MMNSIIVLIAYGIIYSVNGECPAGNCDETQTCCETAIPGQHACCPQTNAVCCSDGIHCCPRDMVCNLEEGRCDNSLVHPVLIKDPPRDYAMAEVMKVANKVDRVYCPGGQSYCPDGNTCCHRPQGGYSCCPYLSASCCQDGAHCCPPGSRCDSTSRYCLQGDGIYSALIKKPVIPPTDYVMAEVMKVANKVDRVYCPGGQYYCPDGNTCCHRPQGGYSCCPYLSASCCQDGAHCCPPGSRCDSTSRYCLQGDDIYPALMKKTAIPMK